MIIGRFAINYCGKPRDEGTCRDTGIFRGKLSLFLGRVKNKLVAASGDHPVPTRKTSVLECGASHPGCAASLLCGNGQGVLFTHKITIFEVSLSFYILWHEVL